MPPSVTVCGLCSECCFLFIFSLTVLPSLVHGVHSCSPQLPNQSRKGRSFGIKQKFADDTNVSLHSLFLVSLFLVLCGACDYKPTTKFAAFGDVFTVTFDTCNGCCGSGEQWITNATIKLNETQEKILPWDSSQGRFWVSCSDCFIQ